MSLLDSGHVRGVRAFRALAHLELHQVAFLQILKNYAVEFLGMKEEILGLSVAGDETESAIGNESRDSSLLHIHCMTS